MPQRLAERGNRRVEVPELFEDAPEPCVGGNQIRLKPDRLAVACLRLVQPSQRMKDVAQVALGRRRIRGEGGQPPGSDLVPPGLPPDSRAGELQVAVRVRRTGVELCRLPEMSERSGLLALLQECVAQVVVRPGEVGFPNLMASLGGRSRRRGSHATSAANRGCSNTHAGRARVGKPTDRSRSHGRPVRVPGTPLRDLRDTSPRQARLRSPGQRAPRPDADRLAGASPSPGDGGRRRRDGDRPPELSRPPWLHGRSHRA